MKLWHGDELWIRRPALQTLEHEHWWLVLDDEATLGWNL